MLKNGLRQDDKEIQYLIPIVFIVILFSLPSSFPDFNLAETY